MSFLMCYKVNASKLNIVSLSQSLLVWESNIFNHTPSFGDPRLWTTTISTMALWPENTEASHSYTTPSVALCRHPCAHCRHGGHGCPSYRGGGTPQHHHQLILLNLRPPALRPWALGGACRGSSNNNPHKSMHHATSRKSALTVQCFP